MNGRQNPEDGNKIQILARDLVVIQEEYLTWFHHNNYHGVQVHKEKQ